MTNTQINEIDTSMNVTFLKDMQNKEHIVHMLDAYDESNGLPNNKKTRLFLLNKREVHSPKLNPTFNEDPPKVHPEITNIMMIIIKAFNENMKEESFDELGEIMSAKTINMFLEESRKAMQKNINDIDKMKNSSGGSSWKLWVIIAAVVILSVVLPEVISALRSSATETTAKLAGDAAEGAAKEAGNAAAAAAKEAEAAAEDAAKAAGDAAKAESKSFFKKIYDYPRWANIKSHIFNSAIGMFMFYSGLNSGLFGKGKFQKFFLGDSGLFSASELQKLTAEGNNITGLSNELNNSEQVHAKRVSDDSEQIQQAAGYVQQAINMFGQAMSFRL